MFQTLPHLIINNIVQYLIAYKSTSSMCDTDTYSHKNRKYLISLLDTCRDWRETAKLYLCKSYSIHFDRWAYKPSYFNPQFPYVQYVKTLEIQIEYSKIFYRDFSNYPITHYKSKNHLVFPNAQRLDITIDFTLWSGREYIPVSKNNGNQAYIQYLKLLVPNITEVYIHFCEWGPQSEDERNNFFYISELLGFLTQMASKSKFIVDPYTTFYAEESEFEPDDLEILSQNLTSIEICFNPCLDIMYLIHRCSPTLESLSMCISHRSDYENLISRGRNDYVVYPNMKKLTFQSSNSFGTNSKVTFPQEVVPFPNLKLLHLRGDFSFGDNVLFRGNNLTLQKTGIYSDQQNCPNVLDFFSFVFLFNKEAIK